MKLTHQLGKPGKGFTRHQRAEGRLQPALLKKIKQTSTLRRNEAPWQRFSHRMTWTSRKERKLATSACFIQKGLVFS